MCVGFDATPAWKSIANRNHGAPFREACSHARVFTQPITQSIQTFGHFFAGMSCQLLGASIHFDSRNDSRLDEDLDKRSAVAPLLGFAIRVGKSRDPSAKIQVAIEELLHDDAATARAAAFAGIIALWDGPRIAHPQFDEGVSTPILFPSSCPGPYQHAHRVRIPSGLVPSLQ